MKENDSKKLWGLIDWKDSVTRDTKCQPNVDTLKNHFEGIYQAEDPNETTRISEITSDVYIPLLDDTICY